MDVPPKLLWLQLDVTHQANGRDNPHRTYFLGDTPLRRSFGRLRSLLPTFCACMYRALDTSTSFNVLQRFAHLHNEPLRCKYASCELLLQSLYGERAVFLHVGGAGGILSFFHQQLVRRIDDDRQQGGQPGQLGLAADGRNVNNNSFTS